MGRMSVGERWTLLVFSLTALAWVFRAQLSFLFPDPKMVTDAAIGMVGGCILFLIPINLKKNEFVMDWHWAAKMPWGVLILFGGGLCLSDGFKTTQLADWIAFRSAFLSMRPYLCLL
ncbi:MAG: anion permease [Geovibrio sp.]|nr:anion permease [Geovibrio sp.]